MVLKSTVMATDGVLEKLTFLAARRGEDPLALLARALDEGVAALYREAIIEDYLAGALTRQQAVDQLGLEQVEEVDARREAFRRDVEWGLSVG